MEIAAIEGLIRSGHADLAGLCLALSDWSGELRAIQREVGIQAERPAAADRRAGHEGKEIR